MKIFKAATMQWWEMGVVKFAVACIALAIGANWPGVFQPYTVALAAAGIVAGLFALYIWTKKPAA